MYKILKLKSLNASLLAIVAVDTAENELSKVSKNYGVESGSCRGYLKAAGLVALLDAAEIAGVDAALILEAQTRVAELQSKEAGVAAAVAEVQAAGTAGPASALLYVYSNFCFDC